MVRNQIDPIARLMQEHDDAVVQLTALTKATRAIASDGFSEEHYEKVLKALRTGPAAQSTALRAA